MRTGSIYDTRAVVPASSLLIISVDIDLCRRLSEILPGIGYSVFDIGGSETGGNYGLILADSKSTGGSFQEFMVVCRRRHPEAEIIVIADPADVPSACEAVLMGALDFIIAPFTSEEIQTRMQKASIWIAMRNEAEGLRRRVALDYGFDNFIGVSEAVENIRHRAMRAVEVESPLMIAGEHGSGRELLARIIHHHSRRRNEAIRVCDGADDDASFDGLDAGTVIIRNIESLSESGQDGLLEKLERQHDFRLIALASLKFETAVESGRFNRVLWESLRALTIDIPPLRSRLEDVPALVGYFLRRIGDDSGRPVLSVTPEAMRLMARRRWPGNVGELENTLKTAAALTVADMIEPDHLIIVTPDDDATEPVSDSSSPRSLEQLERVQILRSLEGNGWNYSQTAQELGIGRTTLWRKIKKYNLRQAATA
ncbi:MAG: helix-turn-helix domain-containing protein [candidate division Zixibacteria bacterium]|nr:helix-turn-helix domain-containing protein [candidate division Zixibacteria bacterium]